MPYYESVFIARQDITGAQSEALAETFAGVIAEGGGKVTKTEPWGLRSLAYKIKKNRKGHYTLLNIDAPAEAVHEMERQMRLHEDVLRFLTLRVDELEEGPSAVLTRQERERGGRGRDRDRDRDRNRNDRSSRGAQGKGPDKSADKAAGKPADKAEDKAGDKAGDKTGDGGVSEKTPESADASAGAGTPAEEDGQ